MGTYIHKVKYNKAGLLSDKSITLDSLIVELTERCNNNCIHCNINLHENDPIAKKQELPTEMLQHIIQEAASLGCMKIRFTGGEPLLREDFEAVYLMTRKAGLKVILFTNATLITPQIAELLSKIPPLEKIEITVYGMKKQTCEAVTRNPDSFEKTQRGIYLLLENNVPFVVRSAFLPPNKKEIDVFETWASSIKWMERPPSYSMFFELRSRRDNPKRNNIIRKLRISPKEGLYMMLRREAEYIEEMKSFCSQYLFLFGDTLFKCGAGISNVCLDAYGYLQPCMPLRHPDTAYSLIDGTIHDALKKFFPEIRKLKATNSDYLARCAKCFIKGLCEQCPGRSWIEHGTFDTPVEYLCDVAHVQARYLGLVKEGENAWEVRNWKKRVSNFTEKEPRDNRLNRKIV